MRFKFYISCITETNKNSPYKQSPDQIIIYRNNTSVILSLLALNQSFYIKFPHWGSEYCTNFSLQNVYSMK